MRISFGMISGRSETLNQFPSSHYNKNVDRGRGGSEIYVDVFHVYAYSDVFYFKKFVTCS
jgi:hypothetical protein